VKTESDSAEVMSTGMLLLHSLAPQSENTRLQTAAQQFGTVRWLVD